MRRKPPGRDAYRAFRPITTRWSDNDVYGHINNVEYYAFFDTVVNAHLIERELLDIHAGAVIGLVVETRCSYFEALAFPDALEGGLRVDRLGRSSVTYGVAIFRAGAARAAAAGEFTHVYVDRETRRPVALPEPLRAELDRLRLND